MSLSLDAEGQEWDADEHVWTPADALLYALAVGAGADPLMDELAFTTENSHGVAQRVLPTFGVLIGGQRATVKLGDFDPARVLHAEQEITLHGALPSSGAVRNQGRLVGFYDKGEDAVIALESVSRDIHTGRVVAQGRSSLFVRGEGGFGGPRGKSEAWAVPDRQAEHTMSLQTVPTQALLYRLTGDTNPLHSDPWVAARAGFPQPILHGQCTYGFTGRALLQQLCDGDPARFGSMRARFSAPVFPGERLDVQIWRVGDGEYRFRTRVGDRVVLDRGTFSTTAAEGAGEPLAGEQVQRL
jgi:acyl dehydratase